MTINEALAEMFGIDFDTAYLAHGHYGVECVLKSKLSTAAEEVIKLGGPSGSTEIRLSHLADYMAHLILALNGRGDEPSSTER